MKKLSHYSLIMGIGALTLLGACQLDEEKADMVITDSSHNKGGHHRKIQDPSNSFTPLSSDPSQENHRKIPVMDGTLNGQNVDISPQTVTPDTQVTYGANH